MRILSHIATVAGIAGVVICLLAGVIRLMGDYYFVGFEILTLFNIGVAAMVFSCLLKLEYIVYSLKR